ncbi:MAG: hypothetical protein Q9198_010276, partial [Flavoplaca austrocitrina]
GYGYTVLPGFFDPPDAPYKYTRNGRARSFSVFERTSNSTASTSHHSLASSRLAGSTLFRTTSSQPPIPLSFYRNITNQIMFGNNSKVCDRMISFWSTSITTGAYEPQAVVGDVLLSPPLVPERKVFRNVPGIKADRAFLEVNYLDCEGLKGFGGTGTGDRG